VREPEGLGAQLFASRPRLTMVSWTPPDLDTLVDSDVPEFDLGSLLELQESSDPEEPQVRVEFFFDLEEQYLANVKYRNYVIRVAQAERRAWEEEAEHAGRRAERIRQAAAQVASRETAEAEGAAEEARTVSRRFCHARDGFVDHSSASGDPGGQDPGGG
jgi:hypothetical protein